MSIYFFQHMLPALLPIVIILLYRFTSVVQRTSRSNSPHATTLRQPKEGMRRKPEDTADLRHLKDLYFKLQNLEKYPDILPHARDTLLLLFAESIESIPARLSAVSGILSIETYGRERLASFLHKEQDDVTKYWEEYVTRRRTGGPRELFQTREDAKVWIKEASPLKYVDGAWLSHLNRASTPFALRGISKNAAQILSEEYGDGDLNKHHVYLYQRLVQRVDSDLPGGSTEDFIHPRHGLTDLFIWKAAVAQLLISLFPHEFLPEILGFNLHFEGVSKETLLASRELRELGFDPFYFLLHISIDNADSGHTAMALQIVADYMDHLQAENDSKTLQRAWKRIQAGFILSQSLSWQASKIRPNYSRPYEGLQNVYEAALEKIFLSKSLASHRIHCNTSMKVGARTLSEWLDPGAMSSHHWRSEFLQNLSLERKLVHRGDSTKSKIFQALSWNGKMFGAFTDSEVKTLSEWIDSLPPLNQVYFNFVGRTERLSADMFTNQDITADYPVFQSLTNNTDMAQAQSKLKIGLSDRIRAERMDFKRLLPLWFAHLALLEGFIVVPSKTATVFGCAAIRFIRAQTGFSIESPCVHGKDTFDRSPTGLHEIGLELATSQGVLGPTSLRDVLAKWPSRFAVDMLRLSMYPMGNAATLFGLAKAFVGLHRIVGSSSVLSDASSDCLKKIAEREEASLQICIRELTKEGFDILTFESAFQWGIQEIESCCN